MTRVRGIFGAVVLGLLAGCTPPEQYSFRPLLQASTAQAVTSSNPAIEHFLRICLDEVGSPRRHSEIAASRGFGPIATLNGAYIANTQDDQLGFVSFGTPQGYQCRIDILGGNGGASVGSQFETAMIQAGAERIGDKDYRIRAKPTLGSGDVIYYYLNLATSAGGTSLVLGSR